MFLKRIFSKIIFLSFLVSFSTFGKEAVDIGVFYTGDVLQHYTKHEIHLLLEHRTDWANVALENSSIDLKRNIVLFEQSPIDNPGLGINAYLEQLIRNDEQFDDYVEQYGLDYITVFIVTPEFDPICGKAPVGGKMTVIQLSEGCNASHKDLLLAHEWGHLDGADHDLDDGGLQKKPYGLGYYCDDTSTIMSVKFNVANRHQFYSNPEIVINDDACGIEDVADVARMIRERMTEPGVIQNTQETMEILTTAAIQMDGTIVSETDGALSGKVVIPVAVAKDVSVQVFTGFGSADSDDFDPYMERVIVRAGETQAAFSIFIIDDDAYEVDEEFVVGIRYGNGVSTDVDNVTIKLLSDEVPFVGQFGFEFEEYEVIEGEEGIIKLVRVNGADTEKTLYISVNNDVISLETDSVTFADGESSREVSFTVNPMSDGDLSEVMIGAGDYELLERTTITVNVKRVGKFAFDESSVAINAGESKKLKIVRSGGSYGEVKLALEISGAGISLAGGAEVVFSDGQMESEITINTDDSSGNSTGTVEIVSGAVITNGQATITVKNVETDPGNTSSSDGGGGSFGGFIPFILLIALRARMQVKKTPSI